MGLNRELLYEKALGVLYGTAIGDALGMPTTFLDRVTIKERYGFVDKFMNPSPDNGVHSQLKAGAYTDDTALTFALARAIIREGKVNPEAVADELLRWAKANDALEGTIIGPSTRIAIERILAGIPVEYSGTSGTTNGCAMKISPVGIFDCSRSYEEMLEDVIKACMPTHYTGIAISGAMAVATAVKIGINGGKYPAEISIESLKMARIAGKAIDGKSISNRIFEAFGIGGRDDQDYLDNLFSFLKEPQGALTEDAVPAALSIFVRSGGDFKRALLLACNLGGDSDTIGAIVGAISGSYCGISGIPIEWIRTIDANSQNDIRKLTGDLVNATQI
ncbi:MAG: ADP-ribosylglycohydrolase family protein [Nitrososphaerota archaeon]|jgi:ADP-ribosylglycohydrolase|nr:ADP-ribosylglycohydrolase family protein [Nitrososphaerota archaeon]MDG6926856.1 ADP-ribosylglycohydrolase family protein [Nitrososphaerota archaeon]MDG6930026.1 ADP-ribosylglycohydrolase family protein [Nitrososphaerota archaeon]MDG6931977.1 ADP-ribosylglycohydrolase family protein [Nitrososphaerota archaeon]MDG6943820.1 ADP-ribosylglycohydrolase family protein [Nitrososphaerota archaeon]